MTDVALTPFEALDVDLSAPLPQTVTAILAASTSLGEDELWALPVGTRIELLLATLALAEERALCAQRRCANEACGEPIEIELAPRELLALAEGADAEALAMHRPTGRDQLAWQARGLGDDDDAQRQAAADLVPGGEALDAAAVAELERVLAAHDPLVCFAFDVACPYCREVRRYELDILGLALDRIAERQDELLAEVHALASHYHWTEAEIAAVPRSRRARYLNLIDAGRA